MCVCVPACLPDAPGFPPCSAQWVQQDLVTWGPEHSHLPPKRKGNPTMHLPDSTSKFGFKLVTDLIEGPVCGIAS